MNKHLILVTTVCLMFIGNINLLAQNKSIQNSKRITKGKILTFKVIGTSDTTKINLSGVILDCKDSLPVGGGIISFYNRTTALKTDFCCTDSSGHFEIWLNNGMYNLEFNCQGFVTYKVTKILFNYGEIINANFCIIQEPIPHEVKTVIDDKYFSSPKSIKK